MQSNTEISHVDSLPSATDLYQTLLKQSQFAVISQKEPEEIQRHLEGHITHLSFREMETSYRMYQVEVTSSEEAFTRIHDLRIAEFEDLHYIPLKELTFTCLGCTFHQEPIQKENVHASSQWPVEYRAELLYAVIIKALYGEVSASKRPSWLFGASLILNYHTQIKDKNGKGIEKVKFFLEKIRKLISPSDYNLYQYRYYRHETLGVPEEKYAHSPLNLTLLNLSTDSLENLNYTIPLDNDLISEDTRMFLSHMQYAYLSTLKQLSLKHNVQLPLFSFFSKNITSSLSRDDRKSLCAYFQKEKLLSHNGLYETIVTNIEQTFSCSLESLIPSYGESAYRFGPRKIKLCWERQSEGLLIRPIQVLSNGRVMRNGLMSLAFTQEIALSIVKYFAEILENESDITSISLPESIHDRGKGKQYHIFLHNKGLTDLIQSQFFYTELYQWIMDSINKNFTEHLVSKNLMHAPERFPSEIELCWQRTNSALIILPMQVDKFGLKNLGNQDMMLGFNRELCIKIQNHIIALVEGFNPNECVRSRNIKADQGYRISIANAGLKCLKNYFIDQNQEVNQHDEKENSLMPIQSKNIINSL